MKTYSGSLQRRGRRYYLVIHKDGRQRWFALKTDKLNLARRRAAEIAPPDPREELAWLEQLARAGDRARERLAQLKLTAVLTWDNLADRAMTTVDAVANEGNRACHAHWIELLAREATCVGTRRIPGTRRPAASDKNDTSAPPGTRRLAASDKDELSPYLTRRAVASPGARPAASDEDGLSPYSTRRLGDAAARRVSKDGHLHSQTRQAAASPEAQPSAIHKASHRAEIKSPCDVNAETAALIMTSLAVKYRSAPRMLSYFRRLWAAIGLDATIWPKKATSLSFDNPGEHYRRLSIDEVRKIHGALKKSAPSLADMVLIGYSTGLRLSDVAELERSELALPFLSVVPNKTRHRKPNPLRIPLTDEALSVVLRLKENAEQRGGDFLFDELARHRPSRRLAAAFRRFGICKQGNGRASFHSLRATFISMMDEAGVSPHITDAITGHGGGGMHARYSHPCDAALHDAVARAIPGLESGGGEPWST